MSTLTIIASALVAVVLAACGFWVARLDNSPRSFGLTALPVAFISGKYWFTSLPDETNWILVSAVVALFGIAMLRPEDKDDAWHIFAMIIAFAGKFVMWSLPWIWAGLNRDAPLWVVLLAFLAVGLGVLAWQRGLFKDRFHSNSKKATSPTP